MHFVEVGSGTPVLAVHGWTPDHRLMLGCLEPVFAARSGYRRLYPDLPAMGRSPVGDVASADDLVATLEDFVDAEIGAEPFLLAGQSYGGYLARALAHRRPDQLLGLALLCPTGKYLRASESTVPELEVRRPHPVVTDLDPVLAEEFVPMAVVQTPEVLRRFVAEVMSGQEIADLDGMARIQQRWELSAGPELGVFDKPTVFLTGRQDNRTGYEDVYALLPQYPYATFAVLDMAGHNLQLEQPALVNSLLNEWLDRVELRSCTS